MNYPDVLPGIALLGPQSRNPSLDRALSVLGVQGPYGAITAGWREMEGETKALAEHIQADVVDLALYERVEDIFASDPALFDAHRQRQDMLKQLQRLYRVRLRAGAEACYTLIKSKEDPGLVRTQLSAATSQLRALDRFHARQLAKAHADFDQQVKPLERPAISEHRRELSALLERLGAVLIAGGHVAVLLSRLRLLGMGELLRQHPVAGWSAGAMVLTDQLVLFHDRAPQGRREPELLDVGLGRIRGTIALPCASQRLDLNNRAHLTLMARRFAPASCVALDDSAFGVWQNGTLRGADGLSRIRRNGVLVAVSADA